MTLSKTWPMIAAAALVGAACHSTPKPTTAAPAAAVSSAPAPVPTRTTPPPPPPSSAPTRTVPAAPAPTEDELFARQSLAQLNASHPLGDAFFDYNEFTLRDDARVALADNAKWLKRWSGTKIKIEGHADERGTAEYNMALGQHRAQAVQDYLISLGVPSNRIEITSLGKEAPFCTGNSESCWSQNRRGHFMVTAK